MSFNRGDQSGFCLFTYSTGDLMKSKKDHLVNKTANRDVVLYRARNVDIGS